MKKLLALTLLTIAAACFGQATVNLGSVTLSAYQVTAMTWFWQNYTNATAAFNADTNNTPVSVLTKTQWFVFECTNLVHAAVGRKTAVYQQQMQQALVTVWNTNPTKKAQIEAILNSP
jgi:hypothetical protein